MSVTQSQFQTIIIHGYTPTNFSNAYKEQAFLLNKSPDKEELEDTLIVPPNSIITEIIAKTTTELNSDQINWGVNIDRVYSDKSHQSLAYYTPLKWLNTGIALFGDIDIIGRIGNNHKTGGHGIPLDREESTLRIRTLNGNLNEGSLKVSLTLKVYKLTT